MVVAELTSDAEARLSVEEHAAFSAQAEQGLSLMRRLFAANPLKNEAADDEDRPFGWLGVLFIVGLVMIILAVVMLATSPPDRRVKRGPGRAAGE